MNFERVKIFIKNVFGVIGIYIGWIILHWMAANLYPRYCAETSLWGIIKSAFVAPAPHCQAMRWVINNGGNMINQMWIVLGTWICGKIAYKIMNV
jgi:hypothetical protein